MLEKLDIDDIFHHLAPENIALVEMALSRTTVSPVAVAVMHACNATSPATPIAERHGRISWASEFIAIAISRARQSHTKTAKTTGVGTGHTLVTRNGQTWSYGSGAHHGLGHGGRRDEPVPRIVATLARNTVFQVAAGKCFSMALTDDGKLFTWGRGSRGALGHNNTLDVDLPREVPGSRFAHRAVSDISAGNAHSMAVADGALYTWGSNTEGQLGIGTRDPRDPRDPHEQTVPTQIPTAYEAVAVAAGSKHSMILDRLGGIMVCGDNSNGQLGFGDFVSTDVFTAVPGVPRAVDVAAGPMRSIAATVSGDVYTWGGSRRNKRAEEALRGIPGHELGRPAGYPRKVLPWIHGTGPVFGAAAREFQNVVRVSVGKEHCMALTATGVLFSWGSSNARGQLGRPESPLWPLIVVVPNGRVVDMACGQTRSVVVTTHQVYSCGSSGLGLEDDADLGTLAQIDFPQPTTTV